MDLLTTLTIGGVDHRVSLTGAALENYWDAYIIGMAPPQYRMASDYGGYVSPPFGWIETTFDPFADNWPPPAEIGVKQEVTATTEAAAQLLFEGKGYLNSLSRDGVRYDFFGEGFDYETPDSTVFNDTLVNVVDWFCDAARLNLTLNSTAARSPSPAVDFTTSGDRLGIELLSDLCKDFTHFFYIENNTLYLVDMFGYSGSRTLTEFDIFPAVYSYLPPVAAISHGDVDYQVVSSYPYGRELTAAGVFHSVQANVESAWTDILTIMHRPRGVIPLPLTGTLPKPGERLVLTDESMDQAVTATMYVLGLRYDYMDETVVCDCHGSLAA